MRQTRFHGRAVRILIAACATTLIAACQDSITNQLLAANQPSIIDPSNVNSAAGADAIRLGVLINLRGITSDWTMAGLVGDEWDLTSAVGITLFIDQRRGSSPFAISAFTTVLRTLATVRTSANQAIPLLEKWTPSPQANIAEMYLARGMGELQIATDFCNGIPLDDGNASPPVYTQPQSNAQIYDVAAASFDSAMTLSSATDAASVNINRAARIGKARALLGNAHFADAAALVSSTLVPTTYSYNFTYATTSGNNPIWTINPSTRAYGVSDSVEGNSRNLIVPNVIPFFSAHDPRLPVSYTVSGKDTTKGADGITLLRSTTLYGQTTPIPMLNGVDARLIEAEARLNASDIAGMMTILNALRATTLTLGTVTVTSAQLAPLPTPASMSAAVSLLFRERAFWTFSRGQRLGDMRRLVRQYGRSPDTVYPTGPYFTGSSTYATDVNLPLGPDEDGNPYFKGCTDLNA
ncbi:MAG TPA: hypothetical protein VHV78_02550 [Gemmatimonadaceae bacterium]|jgi:hypothetical protein|nr:hypothetical protein [Gemmatimonadaceae bacterium]